MTNDQIGAEEAAVQSLSELLAQARKCKLLHEQANMSLPEPLKRVLGMNGYGRTLDARPRIPPLERTTRPPEAQDNWISIPVKDATPTSVVLALLRVSHKPMRAKEVVDNVIRFLPNVRGGSVANIGSRLQDKLINRTPDGWAIIDSAKAGILHGGMIWGPPDIFEKTEVAAHRREAILHLLACQPSGLQITQLVEQLSGCSWVHAPVSKDLLKADMDVLKQGDLVRRRGNSKKWEKTPDDKKDNRQWANT